jgi:hypothetical protein
MEGVRGDQLYHRRCTMALMGLGLSKASIYTPKNPKDRGLKYEF